MVGPPAIGPEVQTWNGVLNESINLMNQPILISLPGEFLLHIPQWLVGTLCGRFLFHMLCWVLYVGSFLEKRKQLKQKEYVSTSECVGVTETNTNNGES